ncbi:MAG: SDR family oxidoreductase [Pseudomonadota bacterium]
MILLTGASGVIGSALAPLLPQDRLILARHRARPGGTARQVAVDIRHSKLGLSDADLQSLCGEVETIVHCAAITDMSGQVPELGPTNIAGVQHVVDLAEAAGADLHFVSTAYCSETYGPAAPVASDYVASKRAAEALIRASSVRWTITRPSIVAGHSESGAIASFQGFHMFIATILKGRLPIIPLARETQCDFVPVDWVAQGIADIVRVPDWKRTYWLTSGAEALTIDEMMQVGTPRAAELGRDLSAVTLTAPACVERDVLPDLRPRMRERLSVLVELSKVMSRAQAFPSDLIETSKEALRRALLANIDFWVAETGHGAKNKRPAPVGGASVPRERGSL